MKYYIELSDKRNRHLYMLLRQEYKTYELILDRDSALDGLPWEKKLPEAGENCTIIFSPARKLLGEEARALPEGARVICGNISSEVAEIFCLKDITHYNLMHDEVFAYSNALLTAEGVLARLLESSEKSIFEHKILIFGCGRCGKAIAQLFNKLGLSFGVVTFDREKCGEARLLSDNWYYKDGYLKEIDDFDIFINTVPAKIIPDSALELFSRESTFFEVASSECLDASRAAFKYLKLPALPLQFASESAAVLMLNAIKKSEVA